MTAAPAILLLGTTNPGKLRELAALVAPLGIECRSLADEPAAVEVAETGSTFAENAALKATSQAIATGRWVLAEDSGLVVDALDGAPGIFSARFAGEHAGDEANNALLLKRLAAVRGPDRSAHYACHAALAAPDGHILAVASGICCGRIAESPLGTGGFGYDPLFIVPEYQRTFGDLSAAVKAVISHRGRALRAMLPAIRRHLARP
jgi:XTP/dITP diphosphohydrolase